MKELLVDLYKTGNPWSGLGQFSLNFAKELAAQATKDIRINFLVPKNTSLKESENVSFVKANLQKRYLPFLTKDYSLWHSLHQFPSHFPNKNTKQILTIHDLNFLVEKTGAKRVLYLRSLQRNVSRADVITTISHYTRGLVEENLDLHGKEVRVIYNGISAGVQAETVHPVYAGDKKFFFSIGIFSRKKNFHVLLPVMKHFEDCRLVIAGDCKTTYGREVRAEIERLGLHDRVILPGKITDGEKQWLYSRCEAFLFPSLAEGFGMPVIEAMKHGKPVFLSKFGSLPEIGGEAAFYFDSFDEAGMAEFIRERLAFVAGDEESFHNKTQGHAEGFNWEKCIKSYLKLYTEIIEAS